MEKFFRELMGLPVLASKHGADVDKLIIYVHYLMAVLFVGWILYFLYALVRFRKAANPKADYVGLKGHLSNYIEAAVAIVEIILLVGFAVPLWAHAVDEFPKMSENPTNIRVIAQQFGWNVFYPGADGKFGNRALSFVTQENPWGIDKNDPDGKDDLAPMSNIIHVPVDKPVIILLTSRDVIHSFKLIAMRVTQDAIPGVPIPLHFTPTKVGVYQINCAQLCGLGHSSMSNGRLYVDTQEDYDKWLASQPKSSGGGAVNFE
ncbi:MAG: coxM [Pedosphaera sp.]|nr:coxM [Pedosphaera sp.]